MEFEDISFSNAVRAVHCIEDIKDKSTQSSAIQEVLGITFLELEGQWL